ncbi:uncharacterized protein Ecym_3234 [Eremothecium cymbalariae DBVPG|uniref:Uncharacterized protein n=1 Tax=Eremothecium cymbalariae (strain CBS 270.75 / DBVPG 7215 / KCTC 17166 / NRRL Y-17582) TaxID=931890 RepID=G8JRF9_ERECY|nr:Hypothetical protein Ecym_3234 [Eremothecium cymbalariae DBVPG\
MTIFIFVGRDYRLPSLLVDVPRYERLTPNRLRKMIAIYAFLHFMGGSSRPDGTVIGVIVCFVTVATNARFMWIRLLGGFRPSLFRSTFQESSPVFVGAHSVRHFTNLEVRKNHLEQKRHTFPSTHARDNRGKHKYRAVNSAL